MEQIRPLLPIVFPDVHGWAPDADDLLEIHSAELEVPAQSGA